MQYVRSLGLAMAVLFGVAQSGFAQDITSAIGRLPVGTTVTYRNSDGPYFTHTVMGKDTKGYRLDYCEGRKADCTDKGSYWVDAKGNMLQFDWPDGREQRYSPHNCQRTLGTCNFTEKRKGEAPIKRRLVTIGTDEGFSYEEFDASTGEQTKRGGVTLGANGLNVRGWYQPTGARRIDLRIVKIAPPS